MQGNLNRDQVEEQYFLCTYQYKYQKAVKMVHFYCFLVLILISTQKILHFYLISVQITLHLMNDYRNSKNWTFAKTYPFRATFFLLFKDYQDTNCCFRNLVRNWEELQIMRKPSKPLELVKIFLFQNWFTKIFLYLTFFFIFSRKSNMSCQRKYDEDTRKIQTHVGHKWEVGKPRRSDST